MASQLSLLLLKLLKEFPLKMNMTKCKWEQVIISVASRINCNTLL
jgi:hypothetical protein